VQEVMQQMTTCHEAFTTQLTDTSTNIIKQQTEQIFDQVQEKVEREVKEIVSRAVKQITDAVAEMRQKLIEGKADSASVRATVEPLIDEIKDLIDSLQSLI